MRFEDGQFYNFSCIFKYFHVSACMYVNDPATWVCSVIQVN